MIKDFYYTDTFTAFNEPSDFKKVDSLLKWKIVEEFFITIKTNTKKPPQRFL